MVIQGKTNVQPVVSSKLNVSALVGGPIYQLKSLWRRSEMYQPVARYISRVIFLFKFQYYKAECSN